MLEGNIMINMTSSEYRSRLFKSLKPGVYVLVPELTVCDKYGLLKQQFSDNLRMWIIKNENGEVETWGIK
jgi:hypothetical protein